MNTLNVLILEPTVDFHESLTTHYRSLFDLAGYQSKIACVINERQLRKQLDEGVIDVVVSDLLLKTEDFAGLIVVQSIKTKFPEVFVIGNTRAGLGYRQTASKMPTFDMFIDKADLLGRNRKALTKIAEEFLAKFRRNTEIEIHPDSQLPAELDNPRFKRTLQSLIAHITFASHRPDPLLAGKTFVLTPLAGGRSKSHVFKMISKNPTSQVTLVPAVLKVSDKDNAYEELDNYNRFVKWVLPYSWRVELLGSGFTEKHGAICYAFALSGNEEFDSLTHYMETGQRKVVEDSISKIFDPSMKKWYSEALIRQEDNINEHYMGRFVSTQTSKEITTQLFSTLCQEVFSSTVIANASINVYGYRYPLPIDRLFGQPNGQYQSCICHGDLNSNNVIVARNGEVIFIDFQHTGRGHVFEDLVAMESSVRMQYRDPNNIAGSSWEQIIQWELVS